MNDPNHAHCMTGAELREIRLKLGLTLRQMGNRLGISLSAMYKLESGKNKISRPVEMLAEKLDHEGGK